MSLWPQLTMVKALNLALGEAMRENPNVLVLGQDVGQDEGVFRVTEGLLQEFGPNRCIDTPLAEAAIVGAGIGLAFTGFLPVCEMQFDGFSFQAFHQVENHVRRFRNRTRGRYTCPLVIRMPYGGGIRAVEHHSEAPEATYAHLAGLKVVIPSGPRNARALLRAAILDPDPVIFFEPKAVLPGRARGGARRAGDACRSARASSPGQGKRRHADLVRRDAPDHARSRRGAGGRARR